MEEERSGEGGTERNREKEEGEEVQVGVTRLQTFYISNVLSFPIKIASLIALTLKADGDLKKKRLCFFLNSHLMYFFFMLGSFLSGELHNK